MIIGNDPILLTPGPMTTSLTTKQAMLRDWGSWDAAFNALMAGLREDILAIANAKATHVCVPLQGSGTFSVEAAIGTIVPKNGKVLVPQNGAYCQRILKICKYLGRDAVELTIAEDKPASAKLIAEALDADPSITHVAQVHCETSAGIHNPLAEIAAECAKRGKGLIVDAMSSFGAIEIDAQKIPFDALISASGKCLEGVPGMGFVIARKSMLEKCAGNSHSLAMDLYDQWVYMEANGRWRYTPPTHVVAALRAAVDQFKAAGGQAARGARYQANCDALIEGMAGLGFRPFLARAIQAPIIVTFHAPDDPNYSFDKFYVRLRERGYILYPGKLTKMETFRVGCIGAIDANEMRNMVGAVALALKDMGIKQVSKPLSAAA
jgi:2-aminoethylphosphonate-pyruvate transaminase